MNIGLPALESICFGLSLSPGTGIHLPPPIRQAIKATPGEKRIVAALDQDNQPLTQKRFSHLVSQFWTTNADDAVRTVLRERWLNPREMRDYSKEAWPMSVAEFLKLEERAKEKLIGFLRQRRIRVHSDTLYAQNPSTHYYFIPAPVPETAITINQNQFTITRSDLKHLIVNALLAQGYLTQTQALFALNTFVSGFPLNITELSFLFLGSWTALDGMRILDEFQRVINTRLAPKPLPTPAPHFPRTDITPAMSFNEILDHLELEWGDSAELVRPEADQDMVEALAPLSS
jgi:hypothetical protein